MSVSEEIEQAKQIALEALGGAISDIINTTTDKLERIVERDDWIRIAAKMINDVTTLLKQNNLYKERQ